MPSITALVHTENDEARIGRALESLRSCDELLVVDHGSQDRTVRVARDYGAIVIEARPGVEVAEAASSAWLLCVLPSEAVSEGLESSIYEWKLYSPADVERIVAVSVFIRAEDKEGWGEPDPETRLVRREWSDWAGVLPREQRASMLLQGDLLRFRDR